MIPKAISIKAARNGIDTLIFLRQALQTAHNLGETLQEFPLNVLSNNSNINSFQRNATNSAISRKNTTTKNTTEMLGNVNILINALQRNVQAPCFQVLQQASDDTFTESTVYSKSSLEMRNQECFAVKSGTVQPLFYCTILLYL